MSGEAKGPTSLRSQRTMAWRFAATCVILITILSKSGKQLVLDSWVVYSIDTQLLILHDLNHHMSFAHLEYCAFTIVSFGMRITTKGFIPASISCRYSLWTILRCLLRTLCICAHCTGG